MYHSEFFLMNLVIWTNKYKVVINSQSSWYVVSVFLYVTFTSLLVVRAVRRLSGASGITQEDKEDLEAVATFRHKITNNKKRKDAPPHNQPLKPTKPHEFHFATDQRLRKNHVEDPAPPPPPQPVHRTRSGPTKPQEFSFATDARLKGKDHMKEDKVEPPVDLPKLLRSSTTSLVTEV